MGRRADRVLWGLIWAVIMGCVGFMLYYSAGTLRAYFFAGGTPGLRESVTPRHSASQVLDWGDCRALEEYLRHLGHTVRVFCGERQNTAKGVQVRLQVQTPTGAMVSWPLTFGPVDNSRTLAGQWSKP
jgi:hypothetical protein